MNVTRRLTRTQANCSPAPFPRPSSSPTLGDIQWNSRQIVKNYMFTFFATFIQGRGDDDANDDQDHDDDQATTIDHAKYKESPRATTD